MPRLKRLAFALGLRLIILVLVYLPFYVRAKLRLHDRQQRFFQAVDDYEAELVTERLYPFENHSEPWSNAGETLIQLHWFSRYYRERFHAPEGFEDLPPCVLSPYEIPIDDLGWILLDSLKPGSRPHPDLERAKELDRLYGSRLIAFVERAVRARRCDWRFEIVHGDAVCSPPRPSLSGLAALMAYRATRAPWGRSVETGLEIYALGQDLRRHPGSEFHRLGGEICELAFDSLRRSLARCPRAAEIRGLLARLEAIGPPIKADLQARRLVVDACFALRSGATLYGRKGCFITMIEPGYSVSHLLDLAILVDRDWSAHDRAEARYVDHELWPLEALRKIQARDPAPWILDYAGTHEEQLRLEEGYGRLCEQARALLNSRS